MEYRVIDFELKPAILAVPLRFRAIGRPLMGSTIFQVAAMFAIFGMPWPRYRKRATDLSSPVGC
jgi:hypothetical protein